VLFKTQTVVVLELRGALFRAQPDSIPYTTFPRCLVAILAIYWGVNLFFFRTPTPPTLGLGFPFCHPLGT